MSSTKGRTAPPLRDVHFGAAVYGSFLAASVIVVASERATATALAGSMLVFWLAHTWSEVVGHRIAAGEAFSQRDVLTIARREWPLVEAAVVPTMLVALAEAGLWSHDTGVTAALAAAILQINVWGFAAARRTGASRFAAGVYAAGEGALGLALLVLEWNVH